MTTHTSTTTYTRTHTATFLSEVIMGAMGDILAALHIDLTRFYRDWDQDATAINAWIGEESLSMVILECVRPSGKVAPIFEFPVHYDPAGTGDKGFVESRAALARYRAKVESVPSGTSFQLFCTFRGPHSPQSGWSPGKRASTDGLSSRSFGSLAEGPHGGVSMRYLS